MRLGRVLSFATNCADPEHADPNMIDNHLIFK